MSTLTEAAATTGRESQRAEWRAQYQRCTRLAVVARANGDRLGARILEAKAARALEKMSTYHR